MDGHFTLKDDSELWYEWLLEHHYEEAKQCVAEQLAKTETDENGCMVSATKTPRRVRFLGGGDRAYRFVLAVSSNYAPSTTELVRHRCHNRQCMNPEHLQFGAAYDNWLDEVDRRANGVCYELL